MDYDGYFFQFGGFFLPKLPKIATVVSSRACPFHCTFCPKLFPEWRYRVRSAENIFQEILVLNSQGYEIIFFQDENFSHDVERLETFCNLVLEHKLKMRFAFQGTIHHLSASTFQLMHKAGFDLLFVGIESGSNAQLSRYKKPSTNESLSTAIYHAKKAHMLVMGFFIHGGPGETLADSKLTDKFIREVKPHVAGTTELHIHFGTKLWNEFVGTSEPQSIDASLSKKFSLISDQHSKNYLKACEKSFEKALSRSWLHWRRAYEVIDLVVFNRSVQKIFMQFEMNFNWLFQLFKGGPIRKKPSKRASTS
ncbi:MAG: radical SAM protein [Deltaproteobacteria bacterium]|nr:radical SAM protein [Deltaproteobacteria bacterium]